MRANLVNAIPGNLAEQSSLATADRQQFLQFRLQPDLTAAIDLDRVTELVNIPLDRIVPMPHLPPAVMGVYNWRGEILWIVDLGQLVGLNNGRSPRHYRSLQPTIIISNTTAGTTTSIGLVVAEIAEIEWCETAQIQALTPDCLQQTLSSWLVGYWKSTMTGAELPIFDGQAIFNCTELAAKV